MVSADEVDVVVVGGGIVGLATARAVLERRPGIRLVLLEKEHRLGLHQTGHNSGVVHSGIYYPPGSHKAALVARSRDDLVRLCERHDIPISFPGKVIVATHDSQLGRLQALHERGLEHGLAVRRLDLAQLHELEPHATGCAAIHVPEAGITDFGSVCQALATEIAALGGEIRLGSAVRAITEDDQGVTVESDAGPVRTGQLVACAGLQADLVARSAGGGGDVRILPFRGEYYDLRPQAAALVRSLIYPVPDPRFPFLGVHLTRGVHGGVHAGPNAVLALAREGYRWRDVDRRHVRDIAADAGVRSLARRYWQIGAAEMYRSVSRRAFARALQQLVPALTAADLVRSPAGVRAQALTADGRLLDDFAFRETPHSVHVINAPSPAATAALGIGEHIAERLAVRHA